MPVANIVDHRSNSYAVEVDVVFEPTWHDNSIKGSTRFKMDERPKVKMGGKLVANYTTVGSLYDTTLRKAITHIDRKYPKMPMTLYVYDRGTKPIDGNTIPKKTK